MNTPHKWAKEIKAWADGKEIQSRCVTAIRAYAWSRDDYPNWFAEGCEFRIFTRHQAVKDAFERGEKIEMKGPTDSFGWESCDYPLWQDDFEFRVKERVFPATSLNHSTFMEIWSPLGSYTEGFRAIANAAIKQYILDQEKK